MVVRRQRVKLHRLGHLQRISDARNPKKIYQANSHCQRHKGKPKSRWSKEWHKKIIQPEFFHPSGRQTLRNFLKFDFVFYPVNCFSFFSHKCWSGLKKIYLSKICCKFQFRLHIVIWLRKVLYSSIITYLFISMLFMYATYFDHIQHTWWKSP